METEQLQKLQEQIQNAAETGDTSALVASSSGMFAGFSWWTIFFGFAFGVFGWWIYKQGRKKQNFGLVGIGIALMVYPYFVYNPWFCFFTGAGLCFGAYKIWNR